MTPIDWGVIATLAVSVIGGAFSMGKLFEKVNSIDRKVSCITKLDERVDDIDRRVVRLETTAGGRRVIDHGT